MSNIPSHLTQSPVAGLSQVQLSHSPHDRNQGYTQITWSASPTPQLSSGQANTPAASKSSTSDGRGRLIWTEDMERALLEALICELNEGRRADSGYKKQSWEAAREAVKAVDNLKQPIQISHCKTKHDNFKRDWKVWVEFTNQSGFSVDENGVVTGNPQAIAAYLEAHPEARRFARAPMKFCDLAQVLFEGVLATGSEVVSIETLISQSIEHEDTATSPSTTSPSATSPSVASPPATCPPAMLPLKRAHTESVSSTRKRTALDRMSDRFGELSYQLSRQTDYQLMVHEASKSDIQQDAIKSFHKHFSILPTGVKLTVLEAFSSDFSAKNFMLMPLDMKKVWTQERISRCRTEIEQKGIDVQQVLSEIEWEGEGELRKKVGPEPISRERTG